MARRIAFLIGNQNFRDDSGLDPLRGPANDVETLSGLLKDPERGAYEIYAFVDKPHYEILPALEETLQSSNVGDLVLIFYSGHGKLTPAGGKLHLATANTRQIALQNTSISARAVHEAVNESACDQIVLLLDCCYSGAVGLRGTIDEVLKDELKRVQDAAGFFILTASTGTQAARESEATQNRRIMGRFTAAICEGIESGIADQGKRGRISLIDIKNHVERTLRGQTPQFFVHSGSGDPIICFNPLEKKVMVDEQVLANLNDIRWHRRLGAVASLAEILRREEVPHREAARKALSSRLSQERDYKVREAIEQALSAIEQGLFSPVPTSARDKPVESSDTVTSLVGRKHPMHVLRSTPGIPEAAELAGAARKVNFDDTTENWKLWGQLVELWICGLQPLPREVKDLVAQATAHGISNLSVPGSADRDVKCYFYNDTNVLAFFLPSEQLLTAGLRSAAPGPYPLSVFYDVAYAGRRRNLTAEQHELFATCRVGEFVINRGGHPLGAYPFFADSMPNWQLWSELVSWWIRGLEPLPKDVESLVRQAQIIGISALSLPGPRDRDVKWYWFDETMELALFLPTEEMLTAGRKTVTPGPYPLPVFYDPAYAGPRRQLAADQGAILEICRVGEYTINKCS
jgi:hypothetical protein